MEQFEQRSCLQQRNQIITRNKQEATSRNSLQADQTSITQQ